jgi:prophage regulatory protein
MNVITSNIQPPLAPALLRLPAVLALVGVSKATVYRWSRAGQFPQPRALTATRSTVAWSSAEVSAWIAGKLAANDGTSDGIFPKVPSKAA